MCSRALWIDEGIIKMDGPSGEVCQAYRESVSIPKRVASTAKV
jgi:ABC-type polysaccharide/polyol phosphate transport system ATPase subunit